MTEDLPIREPGLTIQPIEILILLRLDLHFFEVRRTIERFWTPAERFALHGQAMKVSV